MVNGWLDIKIKEGCIEQWKDVGFCEEAGNFFDVFMRVRAVFRIFQLFDTFEEGCVSCDRVATVGLRN